MSEMKFSVILPVCHGSRFLKEALRSLGDIDYPYGSFEVLVAGYVGDRESKDITESISSLLKPKIIYIETGTQNRSAMLNLAIDKAEGQTLVFADDDCIFLPDWLNNIEAMLKSEPDIGVIGGQDMHGEHESSFNLALDHVFNSFIGTGGLRRDTGQKVGKYFPKLWNMAIPRDIAYQAAQKGSDGPGHIFNESLAVHEDVELVHRIEQLGKRTVYAPGVRVLHFRDTTLPSFIRRNFNMARTSRSIGVHRFPHIVLTIFALGMPALLVSFAVFQPVRHVLVTILACYSLILVYTAVAGFAHTKRLTVFVFIPVLLVSLHLARGLGFLFPWHRERLKVRIS